MFRSVSRWAIAAAFAVAIAVTVPAYGSGTSLLSFELKSLGEPERHSLDRYRGQPVLMVFFEPDCNWCLRQIRAINELRASCPGSVAAIAVGVNGNRSQLQKTLRRMRPEFPAYEASPELVESLGGVPATPFTLLGDTNGEFVNWTRGFIKTDELRAFVAEHNQRFCVDPPP